MNQPPTPQAPEGEKLPFGPEWQSALAYLLVEDERFAETVGPHVSPKFFDHEVCQWLLATAAEHKRRYGVPPTWGALEESARKLDPRTRPTFELGLQQIRSTPGNAAEWVRRDAVEWVRRNVFVRAFRSVKDIYNGGNFDRAVEVLLREMDAFNEIVAAPAAIDETWLFDDLQKRQAQRFQRQAVSTITPTGIPQLDDILGGGLDYGQLGLIMAYSGVGKTTTLTNLGRVAVRSTMRNVAHFFFEGSMAQITNRYDASFSTELYTAVKRGEFGTEKYRALYEEYQYFRRKLYVRSFADKWDCTVHDVWEAMERLRKKDGWVPEVVIIDYADLLHGRGRFENEYDSNAAAYRDLKTLSTRGRGFAVWTAAQAKKPKDDSFDTKAHLLKSNDLGGRYEKVKVADVILSINATLQERQELGQMRIWLEKVRDNPGGQEITVPCDFSRMVFGAGAFVGQARADGANTQQLNMPPPNARQHAPAAPTGPALGYGAPPPLWTRSVP